MKAIARGIIAPSVINLIMITGFQDIEIDGKVRTAINMIFEPR